MNRSQRWPHGSQASADLGRDRGQLEVPRGKLGFLSKALLNANSYKLQELSKATWNLGSSWNVFLKLFVGTFKPSCETLVGTLPNPFLEHPKLLEPDVAVQSRDWGWAVTIPTGSLTETLRRQVAHPLVRADAVAGLFAKRGEAVVLPHIASFWWTKFFLDVEQFDAVMHGHKMVVALFWCLQVTGIS